MKYTWFVLRILCIFYSLCLGKCVYIRKLHESRKLAFLYHKSSGINSRVWGLVFPIAWSLVQMCKLSLTVIIYIGLDRMEQFTVICNIADYFHSHLISKLSKYYRPYYLTNMTRPRFSTFLSGTIDRHLFSHQGNWMNNDQPLIRFNQFYSWSPK